ncbi:KDEL motif-containing, partial [Brachionus plicatilis]
QNTSLRVRHEILDRHDGVFIVRFRIYQNYQNLVIVVKDKDDNHLDQSPYNLEGDVIQDNCECIETNISKWYNYMQCNETYSQIYRDLDPFKKIKIDMDKFRNVIIKKFNQRFSQSLCNYVIKNNKVYRKCFGEYVGFSVFADNIFLSLTRKVKLPDLEFFMNLGDWPLNEKSQGVLLPIVSWCGSKKANDMVLPTYDMTESTLEMMGRQSLDILSVLDYSLPEWNSKINKSFWRGRDSRQERLRLVDLSEDYPNIIDAALTNLFFYREPENLKKYSNLTKRTPFFDFFKYKYQLNIDGTVAAYRFPYLISGNSLVLKQQSEFYEHFYNDLEPFEHYLPVNRDLSNLKEMIEWALSNDAKAYKIAKNAQDYAKEYLMPNHIFCYHVKFLMAYAELLISNVKILEGMELVRQPMGYGCNCNQENANLKAEL